MPQIYIHIPHFLTTVTNVFNLSRNISAVRAYLTLNILCWLISWSPTCVPCNFQSFVFIEIYGSDLSLEET